MARGLAQSDDLEVIEMGNGTALFSSSSTAWRGFLLEKPYVRDELKHFAFADDLLLLHLESSDVTYKVGAKQHRYAHVPGSISIAPSQFEYSAFTCRGVAADRIAVRLDRGMLSQLTNACPHLIQPQFVHHDGFHDPNISTLVRLMKQEIDANCPTGAIYAESLSIALLSYLLSRYSVGLTRSPANSRRLSEAQLRLLVDYVYAHFARNVGLSELGSLLQTSPFDLCRLFKNTMGVTPHRYVLGLRIEESKRLLAETGQSVAEISLALGFSHQSHFSRTFVKLIGITPSQYRREQMRTVSRR